MTCQVKTDKPSSDSTLTVSRMTRSNRRLISTRIAFGISGSFSRLPFLQERDGCAKTGPLVSYRLDAGIHLVLDCWTSGGYYQWRGAWHCHRGGCPHSQ